MPNVNFTSSSIAQQDRFAQTTVSYESRNMQAIPFYPDVDHKAKFRGILILTLIWSVVIGAVFGLIYGYRDLIFKAAESAGASAWFGGGDNDEGESAKAPARDEEISFALASATSTDDTTIEDQLDIWQYIYPYHQKNYSFIYDGTNKTFDNWDDPIIKEAGYPIEVAFSYVELDEDGKPININNRTPLNTLADWPSNAGNYLVFVHATAKGKTVFSQFPLTIAKKAYIPFPGIDCPADGTKYTGDEFKLSVKVKDELTKLGIKDDQIKFNIQYKSNYSQYYSHTDSVLNAGDYKVTLIIEETANTKRQEYTDETVEFTIAKANFPIDVNNEKILPDKSKDFDGEALAYTFKEVESILHSRVHARHWVGLNVNFAYDFIDGPRENKDLFNGRDAINHGIYTVTAYIKSNNYLDAAVTATLTINKAELTPFYTVNKGASMTYDAKYPDASDGIYLSIKPNMPDYIKVYYTFYKGTKVVEADKLQNGIMGIVNSGKYMVVPTFARSANSPDNYNIPGLNGVEPLSPYPFEVKKAKLTEENVKIDPFTDTYTGHYFLFPEENITVKGLCGTDDITDLDVVLGKIVDTQTGKTVNRVIDAGNYEVEVIVSGENYEAITKVGSMVIKKASFKGILNLNISNQSLKKDGKNHLPTVPKYSFNNGYQPIDFDIYFAYDGKQLSVGGEDGVSTLGDHKMMLVAYDKNHEISYPVTLTIQFNPMTIVMGIILGIAVGFIVALLILMSYRSLEKRSFNDFKGVRLRLQHERGGDRGAIVCEGRVMILNFNSEQEHRDFPWIVEPRFGRLFLTHATLEYYDSSCSGRNIKTYKNYRNFLVQLKEVTGVEIRGTFFRSKLIVFARGARHVFYVEPNTAYLWRRDIMHFRDLAHLYPMENNVVDNNYPFNYTLLKSDKKDPTIPDNV